MAKALLKGTGAITKAIDSIQRRGAKLDADIQHCALSILAHVDEHRNVTLVNTLYLALSAGTRKAAMSEWLLAFGKVKANEGDDKKAVPFLLDDSKKTDLVLAEERPWFSFKPDAAPDEVFDFAKALQALLVKAGKKDQTKLVGGELLAQVRALVPAEKA